MSNLKNLNKEYKFSDGIGWLKFNFRTKSWWFYTSDGIPHDMKLFDMNEAIYRIQITKRVLAELDGFTSPNGINTTIDHNVSENE